MRKKAKMNVTLNDVLTILQEHESFVITTHVNPDGDAIGSLLALGSFLEKMKKKSIIIQESYSQKSCILRRSYSLRNNFTRVRLPEMKR